MCTLESMSPSSGTICSVRWARKPLLRRRRLRRSTMAVLTASLCLALSPCPAKTQTTDVTQSTFSNMEKGCGGIYLYFSLDMAFVLTMVYGMSFQLRVDVFSVQTFLQCVAAGLRAVRNVCLDCPQQMLHTLQKASCVPWTDPACMARCTRPSTQGKEQPAGKSDIAKQACRAAHEAAW